MLFVVFKIVGDSMYNSIYILILAGVHGQAGLAVAVLCVAGGGKLSAVHCPVGPPAMACAFSLGRGRVPNYLTLCHHTMRPRGI